MTFMEFFARKHPGIGSDAAWWGNELERYEVALTRLIDTLIEFIDSRLDDKDDRSAV